MNRCAYCGKFRKWKDLIKKFTPDTHFTSEELYFVCRKCNKK